ncbi:MAG TPA: hypothetical protein PLW77_10130 [Bacteroidales bacterium]|nr:hypothetical protein [Bacteroidales bacterium]
MKNYGFTILDFGFEILDLRFWICGFTICGFTILDFGFKKFLVFSMKINEE